MKELYLLLVQYCYVPRCPQGGDARGKGDPKAAETVQKINDCFFKALQHYSAVLRKDEHNIYAANGIAAVLAEKGNLMQAKEVLTSVCAPLSSTGGCFGSHFVWDHKLHAAFWHSQSFSLHCFTNMMAALIRLVCLSGKDLHEHAGTCEEVGRKICEDLPAWRLQ